MEDILKVTTHGAKDDVLHVCIVGAGTRFLSGISHYVIRLTNSLADSHQASAILMRQLLPTRFYPGKERVGQELSHLKFASSVRVMDGVDWYWIPSIIRAINFLRRERPDVVVFQWWSGTVLHSYIALAMVARLLGAQVVIEYHEVLDTGEARILWAKSYVALGMPLLRSLATGFVVHSEYDRGVMMGRQNPQGRPVMVIHVRAFDDYKSTGPVTAFREAPPGCCNMLFFGVIRPFKGLEDVLAAFESIPESEIGAYWLTVVGETWEGWTLPAELISKSKYASRITFVNRYVHDDEVSSFFAGADVALAPYHRSSVSGPLDIALSWGLPIIVTNVGGLTEAVSNYEGAILVPPENPVAIQNAMKHALQMHSQRFTSPHTWDNPIPLYDTLFVRVANGRSTAEKTSA